MSKRVRTVLPGGQRPSSSARQGSSPVWKKFSDVQVGEKFLYNVPSQGGDFTFIRLEGGDIKVFGYRLAVELPRIPPDTQVQMVS